MGCVVCWPGNSSLQLPRHLPCPPKEGECVLPWLSRALCHLSAFPSPFSEVAQTHPPCSQGPAPDGCSVFREGSLQKGEKSTCWGSLAPPGMALLLPGGVWAFSARAQPLSRQGQPAPAPSTPGCVSRLDGVIFPPVQVCCFPEMV